MPISITPYFLASRFLGVKEAPGASSTPAVLAMLQLDAHEIRDDAIPWCSAFVNTIAYLLELPRSRSLAARSWLNVGTPIELDEARPDCDVVILTRDGGGHVGFYASQDRGQVLILGGNQHDAVSIAAFPIDQVLGVRRLERGRERQTIEPGDVGDAGKLLA